MLTDIFFFRFPFDATAVAGASLWALSLYLGFYPLSQWVTEQFNRWFNFAERSLYTSEKEFERTRKARESQNAFYASLCSILPFFVVGVLCNYGIYLALGSSWAISVGMISCIGSGVYELGRRNSSNY